MPHLPPASHAILILLAIASSPLRPTQATAQTPGEGASNHEITTRDDTVGKLLKSWREQGSALPLAGFLYDNRDRGHSTLDIARYPGLAQVGYSEQEKDQNLDQGPANRVRPQPTFGNSSMSTAPEQGGSLPRMYYSSTEGLQFLTAQYFRNNLFVYPEHRDHDPGSNGKNGYGDLYPANTPYLIISQGSSGSDRPFVDAMAATAAALRPDVRSALIQANLLAPTLQQIFRMSQPSVAGDAQAYTSAGAHPTVFQSGDIDEEAMVRRAQAMTISDIPPVMVLQAESESAATHGIDFFEAPTIGGEKLADTPAAIARIFRSSQPSRQITVDASRSADGLQRPLTFRWSLLRGNPEAVRIEPLDERGTRALITVAWQPSQPVSPGSTLRSPRIDVGVFASNGTTWSAPAFVTFYCLPNEGRLFAENGRTVEIDYSATSNDPGLPPPEDRRWLALLRKIAIEESFPAGLLRQALDQSMIDALAAQYSRLSALEPEEDQEDAMADRRRQMMVEPLAALPSGASNLHELLQAALVSLLADHHLQFREHQRIAEHAAATQGANHGNVDAERQRLTQILVLQRLDDGRFAPRQDPVPSNDLYHLQQLNLTILGEVLLPGFLDRRPGPHFVDQRLSTPKPWRDVYRYDAQGNQDGWLRLGGGAVSEYTKDGLLILGRDGRGDVIHTTPVQYQLSEDSRSIVAIPPPN